MTKRSWVCYYDLVDTAATGTTVQRKKGPVTVRRNGRAGKRDVSLLKLTWFLAAFPVVMTEERSVVPRNSATRPPYLMVA